MKEFKVGDMVYHPMVSNKMYVLSENNCLEYPLKIDNISIFTNKGMFNICDTVPSILHATPENHELLEKLYGVEFEKPKLTGEALVKKLVGEGKQVLCQVWNNQKSTEIELINECDGNCFNDRYGFTWKHAIPISETDIEYVTGGEG